MRWPAGQLPRLLACPPRRRAPQRRREFPVELAITQIDLPGPRRSLSTLLDVPMSRARRAAMRHRRDRRDLPTDAILSRLWAGTILP